MPWLGHKATMVDTRQNCSGHTTVPCIADTYQGRGQGVGWGVGMAGLPQCSPGCAAKGGRGVGSDARQWPKDHRYLLTLKSDRDGGRGAGTGEFAAPKRRYAQRPAPCWALARLHQDAFRVSGKCWTPGSRCPNNAKIPHFCPNNTWCGLDGGGGALMKAKEGRAPNFEETIWAGA